MKLGVGDVVLGLWFGAGSISGTRHHDGQRAAVRLELHDVELLLVGQRLVSFLQGSRVEGQRGDVEKMFFFESPKLVLNMFLPDWLIQ